MSTTPMSERLAQLDAIHLDSGGHLSWQAGHCVNEVAAWLGAALDLLDRLIEPSAVEA